MQRLAFNTWPLTLHSSIWWTLLMLPEVCSYLTFIPCSCFANLFCLLIRWASVDAYTQTLTTFQLTILYITTGRLPEFIVTLVINGVFWFWDRGSQHAIAEFLRFVMRTWNICGYKSFSSFMVIASLEQHKFWPFWGRNFMMQEENPTFLM